jgi:hypothetical protein
MGCIAIRQRRNHLASFLSQSFKLLLRSVLDEESHPHLLALALPFIPSLSPSLGSPPHFPFTLPLSLFLSPPPPPPSISTREIVFALMHARHQPPLSAPESTHWQ